MFEILIFRPLPLLTAFYQEPQYYREDDIVFPFFHVIFFLTAMMFPSPLHNLIFLPNFDKLPPPQGVSLEHFWGAQGSCYVIWATNEE